jgi:hypothetical protein
MAKRGEIKSSDLKIDLIKSKLLVLKETKQPGQGLVITSRTILLPFSIMYNSIDYVAVDLSQNNRSQNFLELSEKICARISSQDIIVASVALESLKKEFNQYKALKSFEKFSIYTDYNRRKLLQAKAETRKTYKEYSIAHEDMQIVRFSFCLVIY